MWMKKCDKLVRSKDFSPSSKRTKFLVTNLKLVRSKDFSPSYERTKVLTTNL